MTNPVQLVLFVQAFGCETCATTKRILEDLTRANALVTLEEKNMVLDTADVERYGIVAAPGLAIIGDRDRGLRFYGAPDGYELISLLEGILLASAGDSGPHGGIARTRGDARRTARASRSSRRRLDRIVPGRSAWDGSSQSRAITSARPRSRRWSFPTSSGASASRACPRPSSTRAPTSSARCRKRSSWRRW